MTTDDTTKMYMVSSSPHAHSGSSVPRIMLDVVIALVPAFIVAVYYFQMKAVNLVAVCIATCLITEAVCRKMMGRDLAIGDLSAVVTGILLAFNLPPDLPLWMAAVGSVVAIAIAKQVFGGLGYNPFNPALVARAALLISRAPQMTSWSEWTIPAPINGVDAVTTATPMGLVKSHVASGGTLPFVCDGETMLDFFLGNMNGCIGEVSAAALLLGGLYLLYRKCISWHTPVFYIGSVAVFAWILFLVNPDTAMPPLFHVLTGGLMLGAIFMATDMVTTPTTKKGQIVFGISCGVITMTIRTWSALPEGVSFAILFMNAFTPLINRATKPRIFGHKK